MLYIPDRISMDDLSKIWIEKALKAIEAEREAQRPKDEQPKDEQPKDGRQDN